MSLLEEKFLQCARENRPAFVAYITAGDPDFERSLLVADTVIGSGADILELGVPFSDPLADGEANQLAAERAINSGMTSLRVLDLAREIRKKHPSVPMVLFTYMNPVAYSGKISFSDYCTRAVESGISAILPLDLPPEEKSPASDRTTLRSVLKKANLPSAGLVAPNTAEDRIKKIAGNTEAFIYYVCREGVTGESARFSADFADKIALIRKYSGLPIIVGFGISTPEHVRSIATATDVDGIVVGSAIVRKIEAFAKGDISISGIADFVKKLADAAKKSPG